MENNAATPPGPALPARSSPPTDTDWTIHYRPMTLLDIPQVHAVDRQSFNLPWPEKSYQYELTQNPNSILWVAEALPDQPGLSPRIVGMIVVWFIVDEAHIATLAVHPAFRRRGLSKKLLALGLKVAIQLGAIESTLEVRESNLAAQKLYEKFGFREVGRRLHYYRDNNEDAVLMTVKDLGTAYLSWLETVIADQVKIEVASKGII